MGALTCAGCGTALPPRKPRAKPRKWCTDACRVRHTRKPTQPKPPRKVPCAICAQPFEKYRRSIYCGAACRKTGATRRRHQREARERATLVERREDLLDALALAGIVGDRLGVAKRRAELTRLVSEAREKGWRLQPERDGRVTHV